MISSFCLQELLILLSSRVEIKVDPVKELRSPSSQGALSNETETEIEIVTETETEIATEIETESDSESDTETEDHLAEMI